MAFPTTSVLDSFTRADENPLSGGGNWGGSTSVFAAADTAVMKIVTNVIGGNSPVGNPNSSYWAASTFGPDCEVFASLTTGGAAISIVYLRLVNTGTSSVNGYSVEADDFGNTVKIYRIDAGVKTQIATVAQAVASGDSFGLSAVGSTLTAYYKVGAGAWSSITSATDATYSAAGNIGCGTYVNLNARLDDFGGGTFVVPADEAAAARTVTTRRCLPPPRGDAKMYVGTFEQTLFSFTTATFPRGTTAPPTFVPKRNSPAVFQVKLTDPATQQEQESGWQGCITTPGKPLVYVQPQTKPLRPPGLPPDPTADVSSVWNRRITNAYRPFSRLNRSGISFVPDMQGPAPSWVKSQWQAPPVLRGRDSRIAYVSDDFTAPRWLGTQTKTSKWVLARQSYLANVFPVPSITPASVITAPTKTMMYRGSWTRGALDFVSSGLQAIPLVTVAGKTALVRPRHSRAVLVEDVEAIDLLEAPAIYRTPPTWMKLVRGPFTRLIWCPQTIATYVRQDDRDSGGADGRGQTATGGSGYSRSSTGASQRNQNPTGRPPNP